MQWQELDGATAVDHEMKTEREWTDSVANAWGL